MAGLEDLYLERTVDVVHHLVEGVVTAREGLQRDGAAARRGQTLHSADGLDRLTLASLTGVPPRLVPTFVPPAPPASPSADTFMPLVPAGARAVRWRWRWAAVVRPGRACVVRRPELLEITLRDDRRVLRAWPPAGGPMESSPAPPASSAPAPLPSRPVTVILAPAAAAVLLHELFGHPCEADLLAAGNSPWRARLGERVLNLELTLSDDPTEFSLPGAFDIDDEGEVAGPRVLVQDGVLVGVLADRRTAPLFAVAPGNARRAGVHAPPRPRMSNLVVAPRDDEIPVPRTEAQVEVTEVAAGTVDAATGCVFLAVSAAHTLRRGHPTRPLPPFTLATSVTELAGRLVAAGGRTGVAAEHGWCGKDGDVVATGARIPWLMLVAMEVR